MRREAAEGFGQSLWDDLRFLIRFHRSRRRAVRWRPPSPGEREAIDAHPILGRFGDQTLLVADVGAERWIVRDRDWWGWPDPPRYVFFALEGDRIATAADFDTWPANWPTDSETFDR